MKYNSRRTTRAAFTIVEVLVVLGVLTLILSVAIPGVMNVRDSSRKLQCMSRLRQIGIATESFYASRRKYPVFLASDPGYQGPTRNDSVLAQLLPYLDQQPLHDSIIPESMPSMGEPPTSKVNSEVIKTNVLAFVCPSDDVPSGGTSFRTNYGTTTGIHATWSWGKPLPGKLEEQGLWGGLRSANQPGKILDGLSNTVFFSERLVGDGDSSVFTPSRDVAKSGGYSHRPADAIANCTLVKDVSEHASYLGWSWLPQGYTHTAYNHVMTPNSKLPDCFDNWNHHTMAQGAMTARSYHAGGVNVVFGDGSSRFISDSIALEVWRALGTNHGGEVTNDF